MVERELRRGQHDSAILAAIAVPQQNVLTGKGARLVRYAAVLEQTNHRRQPHRQPGRVQIVPVLFLSNSHALQHEYERTTGGTDVDRLIRRIQDQYR